MGIRRVDCKLGRSALQPRVDYKPSKYVEATRKACLVCAKKCREASLILDTLEGHFEFDPKPSELLAWPVSEQSANEIVIEKENK